MEELNKAIENTISKAQKATEKSQTLQSKKVTPSNDVDKIEKNNYNDIAVGEIRDVPTKEMMSLYNGGGYRTDEQISSLKESIKKNGINTPIEIVKKPNGDYAIENGNHRLQIANELGIKEVPVKLVESWEDIVARKANKEVKIEYGVNTITETDNTSNEKSGSSSRVLRNSDELPRNRRRTTRNAEISISKSDGNQQTSSLQNKRTNREKKNLKNSNQSSFSLPKTDNTNPTTNTDILKDTEYEYTSQKDKLHIERAEEKFGYTDDFEKAGYLTRNRGCLILAEKQTTTYT